MFWKNRFKWMGIPQWVLAIGCLTLACKGRASSSSAPPSPIPKGYLGVEVERLTEDDKKDLRAPFGVLVVHVVGKSPADIAGIEVDDVIQSFGNRTIRRPEDLSRHVRAAEPGKRVKIALIRDAKPMDVSAEIGRIQPADPQRRERPGVSVVTRPRGFRLGLRLAEINADLADYFRVEENEGALVLNVEEDSPAERAGLRAGDVIVELGEEKVEAPEDVQDLLQDYGEGDSVPIVLIRKGIRQTVSVSFEEGDEPVYSHGEDIRIDIDEDFKENLKQDLERLKEELNDHLEKLQDIEVTVEGDVTI